MTFKIESETISEWKLVVTFLTKLVDKATFAVDKNGITLKAMDPSHVALADLNMPSSAFKKYETDSDDEQKFTISLETFNKAIQRASSTDGCVLYSDGPKSLHMSLSGSYARQYTLALEAESVDVKMTPTIDFKGKSSMKSYVLDNVVNDVNAVSDKIVVQARDKKLEFLGKNDSAGNKVVVALDLANAGVDTLDIEENFKVQFSLKYLLDIMSVGKETDTIYVDLAGDKPLRLGFKIGLYSTLDFYLAPRSV